MDGKTLLMCSFITVSLILPAESNIEYKPRKMTVSEVKSNENLQLETLLLPNVNVNQKLAPSKSVPLSHLPKGTNLEAGAQDSIRYVMHR